ncbi:V-ATPase V1 sector subunit E [Elasticomyces elasticus]|uniref:V-ATPase V1 sector subunit E n=1 Tax=Exophiala sideris TaxID=1016849 RepID=A0ABR0J565_9EURO|nr:V-ATPase V1 sector subunit E [Elasticomyces elasticus]KAK5027367.1 V-ATPase V1 sector subunit E [Exophiala sideris]KAK5034931.1 V-ATPase V1 sector subunit E [Exophiala sideris]KAK5056335.1 V-ATPase V1 sector subunit E [Exophiala sideris]KAK5181176.1 V-ATPase V1 sector subunit E [Eurotiomycetes sp. CCFEE 6388]
MSSSHALSDDQVASELKKMTAFIRQEALEKAREIQLKADEEFAIEKSRLVREEIAAIDKEYEKKSKQASMSQQITRSTMTNKTRIKVLSSRQELLDKLFEEARGKLAEAANKDYEEMLKGLILEGLYMLCESKVAVRCKQADKEKVESAAKKAAEEYKEKVGSDVEPVIDEKNWLPEESAGGVYVVGGGGKIELNNTLEERLRMCETDALPSIRATLFGENQNRRFHD